MLKKIILAGATAGLLAAASLGAMTTAASAAPLPYGGQSWGGQHQPFPHPDCRPTVRTVKWYDWFGYPHWRQVVVNDHCGDFNHPRWDNDHYDHYDRH